jgi:deferrochelatase/peroxidase EfeB
VSAPTPPAGDGGYGDGRDRGRRDDGAGDGARTSRRRFLGWLGAAGVGAATGAAGVRIAEREPPGDVADAGDVVPFYGAHQAGIATPRQRHLVFASLDAGRVSRDVLGALFRYWTRAAARMTRGGPVEAPGAAQGVVWDTGEAMGLGPNRLTVTFGVGPSLFVSGGRDRFGLAGERPDALADLPPFATDRLEPSANGGDLCIQACADDEQVAFHAVRELVRLGHGLVRVRWTQPGFVAAHASGSTPRNLLGFKDGTSNIDPNDGAALERFVWAGSEAPPWLRGGTIAVARRIDILVDRWDGSTLAEQEAVIGRRKGSGAPLSGRAEHDPIDLLATGSGGAPLIAPDAHVRLALPESNGGQRILRRPYSFVDRGGAGNVRAGLFFIAYQRDPSTQFVPIQERLARSDALNEYVRHTGSAVFAMLPGVAEGDALGRVLFGTG